MCRVISLQVLLLRTSMSSTSDEDGGFPMTQSPASSDEGEGFEATSCDESESASSDDRFAAFDPEEMERPSTLDNEVPSPASKRARLQDTSVASVPDWTLVTEQESHHVYFPLDPLVLRGLQSWQRPLLAGLRWLRKIRFDGHTLLRPMTHDALMCGNITEFYGFKAL